MFRIEKGEYELEVFVKGQTVRVRPITNYLYIAFFCRTLARCEEFLAQQFCRENWGWDKRSMLENYFQERGWQVCS